MPHVIKDGVVSEGVEVIKAKLESARAQVDRICFPEILLDMRMFWQCNQGVFDQVTLLIVDQSRIFAWIWATVP